MEAGGSPQGDSSQEEEEETRRRTTQGWSSDDNKGRRRRYYFYRIFVILTVGFGMVNRLTEVNRNAGLEQLTG